MNLPAKHGIPLIERQEFSVLPHNLAISGTVACQGMPPYKLWEENLIDLDLLDELGDLQQVQDDWIDLLD